LKHEQSSALRLQQAYPVGIRPNAVQALKRSIHQNYESAIAIVGIRPNAVQALKLHLDSDSRPLIEEDMSESDLMPFRH